MKIVDLFYHFTISHTASIAHHSSHKRNYSRLLNRYFWYRSLEIVRAPSMWTQHNEKNERMRTSKRRSTNDCLIYRNFRLLSHFVHSDIWTYDISLREVKNSNQTLEIVVYKGALITVMHHKINTHLHCRNHTHLGMVFLLARGIGMLQQSINCLLALAHASHWANRLHSSQWMYDVKVAQEWSAAYCCGVFLFLCMQACDAYVCVCL